MSNTPNEQPNSDRIEELRRTKRKGVLLMLPILLARVLPVYASTLYVSLLLWASLVSFLVGAAIVIRTESALRALRAGREAPSASSTVGTFLCKLGGVGVVLTALFVSVVQLSDDSYASLWSSMLAIGFGVPGLISLLVGSALLVRASSRSSK